MSDTSSVRTASRASTLLNRPQIAPMGPRTRQSSTRTSRTFSDHGGGNVLNSLDLSEFGVRRVSSPAPSGTTPPRAPSLRAASPAPPAAPPLSVHNSNSENPPVSPMMNSFSFSPAQARKSLPVVSEPTVEEDSEPESPVQLRPESPVAEDSEDEFDAPISPVREEPESPLPLVEPESEPELRPQPPEPPAHTAHAITQQAPAPDTEYPESPVESAPAYVEQPAPIASSSSQQPQVPKIITAPVSQPKSPPKLIPPPAIKFDTTSVEWKGLPLDAAVWTVDSVELQMIVSRAIRSSAKESFIRILTLENIDTVLPAELARLDAAKAMAQSKYRFLVHRRNMQFQALNSTALGQQKDGEDGVSVVARLAAQLSETITECEKHLEEVISINDQIAQINKLIDVHWAGALAIALRKLNGSYARRTTDLTAARERIKQLEGELEDAWKEAEKMAGELDDYEAAIAADDTEAIIEVAEVVAVPRPPSGTLNRRISTPMSPTLVAFTPLPASSPSGAVSPISPASPTSSPEKHFSFPPPIHMKAKETEAEDVPDSVSIKSTRSTRSAKSARSNRSGWTADSNHTSSVHAARKRSHRASQASLRLSVGGRKVGSSRSPPEERPPVPELPLQFSSFSSRGHASAANASSIFLPLDSVHHHSTPSTPGLRRQQSLDSVITNGNVGRVGVRVPPPNPDAYRRAAADDLYVRLKSQNPGASEIQLVPRTPVPAPTFATAIGGAYSPPPSSFAPPNRKLGSMGRLGNLKAASSKIPSMWMNADAIKPPPPQLKPLATDLSIKSSSEHSSDSVVRPLTSVSAPVGTLATTSELGKDTPEVSRQRSFRNSTVSKIRGLTKRYSVSLPLFNVKAPSSSKSSHDEPRMSG